MSEIKGVVQDPEIKDEGVIDDGGLDDRTNKETPPIEAPESPPAPEPPSAPPKHEVVPVGVKIPEKKDINEGAPEKPRKEQKREEVSHVSLIQKRHKLKAEQINTANIQVKASGKMRFTGGKLYAENGKLMADSMRERGDASERSFDDLRWFEENLEKDGIDCSDVIEWEGRQVIIITTLNEHGELEASYYDVGPVEKKEQFYSDSGGSEAAEVQNKIKKIEEKPKDEESWIFLDIAAYLKEIEAKNLTAETTSFFTNEDIHTAASVDLAPETQEAVTDEHTVEDPTVNDSTTETAVSSEEDAVEVPTVEDAKPEEEKVDAPAAPPAAKPIVTRLKPAITFENSQIVFAQPDTDPVPQNPDAPLSAPDNAEQPAPAAHSNVPKNIRMTPEARPERSMATAKIDAPKQELIETPASEAVKTEAAASEPVIAASAKEVIKENYSIVLKNTGMENKLQEKRVEPTEVEKKTVEATQPVAKEIVRVEAPTTQETKTAAFETKVVEKKTEALSHEEALLRSFGFTNEMVQRYKEGQQQGRSGFVPTAEDKKREIILEEDPDSGIKLMASI